MKPAKHNIFLFTSLLLNLCILTGCLSENRDHCPDVANVNLYFSFPSLTTELIKDISIIDVYIFDEDYHLVGHYEANNVDIESNNFKGVSLQLEEGIYNIVCWGNICSTGEILSYGSMATMQLMHENLPQNEPAFYAPLQDIDKNNEYEYFTINVSDNKVINVTIPFMHSHREIKISVSGYIDSENNTLTPKVGFKNVSAGYDFLLTPLEYKTSYELETIPLPENENMASATIYTPFSIIDNDIEIMLIKSSDNTPIYTNKLQEILLSKGMDPGYTGDIHIHFGYFSGNMEITIPGWDIEEIQ